MTGRAEVRRMEHVLDATFARAAKISGAELELQSDFARYLCVLVSGFLEKAVAELIIEHARQHARPTLLRYVESNVRRTTNLKSQRLTALLGTFDDEWLKDLNYFLVDEIKAARR